jgi:hypothetical protein
MVGRWGVFESRISTSPVGYFVDGEGMIMSPGRQPFSIVDNRLIDPDGKVLGYLAQLERSWAVNLGDHEVGHILRQLSDQP